eukprot:1159555-Pelagomonas_calceolata.AAC.16
MLRWSVFAASMQGQNAVQALTDKDAHVIRWDGIKGSLLSRCACATKHLRPRCTCDVMGWDQRVRVAVLCMCTNTFENKTRMWCTYDGIGCIKKSMLSHYAVHSMHVQQCI